MPSVHANASGSSQPNLRRRSPSDSEHTTSSSFYRSASESIRPPTRLSPDSFQDPSSSSQSSGSANLKSTTEFHPVPSNMRRLQTGTDHPAPARGAGAGNQSPTTYPSPREGNLKRSIIPSQEQQQQREGKGPEEGEAQADEDDDPRSRSNKGKRRRVSSDSDSSTQDESEWLAGSSSRPRPSQVARIDASPHLDLQEPNLEGGRRSKRLRERSQATSPQGSTSQSSRNPIIVDLTVETSPPLPRPTVINSNPSSRASSRAPSVSGSASGSSTSSRSRSRGGSVSVRTSLRTTRSNGGAMYDINQTTLSPAVLLRAQDIRNSTGSSGSGSRGRSTRAGALRADVRPNGLHLPAGEELNLTRLPERLEFELNSRELRAIQDAERQRRNGQGHEGRGRSQLTRPAPAQEEIVLISDDDSSDDDDFYDPIDHGDGQGGTHRHRSRLANPEDIFSPISAPGDPSTPVRLPRPGMVGAAVDQRTGELLHRERAPARGPRRDGGEDRSVIFSHARTTETAAAAPASSGNSLRSQALATNIHLPKASPPRTKPPPIEHPLMSTYNCPICLCPPTYASVTPCGHVFCGECLFDALKTQAVQREESERERDRVEFGMGLLGNFGGLAGMGGGMLFDQAGNRAVVQNGGARERGRRGGGGGGRNGRNARDPLAGHCPVCRADIKGGFGGASRFGIQGLEIMIGQAVDDPREEDGKMKVGEETVSSEDEAKDQRKMGQQGEAGGLPGSSDAQEGGDGTFRNGGKSESAPSHGKPLSRADVLKAEEGNPSLRSAREGLLGSSEALDVDRMDQGWTERGRSFSGDGEAERMPFGIDDSESGTEGEERASWSFGRALPRKHKQGVEREKGGKRKGRDGLKERGRIKEKERSKRRKESRRFKADPCSVLF